MQSSKCIKAKIDKRLQYYLIGFALGCLVLVVLPRPFKINRSTFGEGASILHGDYPFTYTDAYNRMVKLPRPPQRIVSLAPSITEIIYALNASEYLVANTHDCDFPVEARNLPKIGDHNQPDFEIIHRLNPDLILGDLIISQEDYKQMADLGLVAIAMKQTHLEVIMHDMLILGKIIGKPNAAMQLVTKIQNKRDLIIERISVLKKLDPVRIIFLYDLEELVIARSNAWFREFVNICQATNIADGISLQSRQLSLEFIAEKDPDIIILALSLEESMRFKKDGDYDILTNHSDWEDIAAVRDHKVVMMEKDLLSSSGLRIIDAMDVIARAIHPEISLAL